MHDTHTEGKGGGVEANLGIPGGVQKKEFFFQIRSIFPDSFPSFPVLRLTVISKSGDHNAHGLAIAL